MAGTADLVAALKLELRAAGITYARLAREIGLAESSVKRLFSRGDLTLSRIDQVLRVLRMDFAELARRVAQARPVRVELTAAQEAAVVADRKLLLTAIMCLSQWPAEQIVASYRISEAECVKYLTRLDRLGVIELRAMNRYRLKVAPTFRWRADGPVMRYFREHVVGDYFSGGFDGDGEMLVLVHGEIDRQVAAPFNERVARLAQDFVHQHLADRRLHDDRKQPCTLLIGMRSWVHAPFRDLRRDASPPASAPRR